MKVICHLVANINDFLPLPSNAHLQYKFQNKKLMSTVITYELLNDTGIHLYSPPVVWQIGRSFGKQYKIFIPHIKATK